MKKTININLGGIAFIIDENAFDTLHKYLEALKKKFDNQAERDEIMHDIELRLAEMFGKSTSGNKEVIGITDVNEAIAILGQPEDIAGDESAENQSVTETLSTFTAPTQPMSKRLFRDVDDAKVGGVIAGLCHYFGISDPVWLRIAAVVLIFPTSGAIIFIYLLLLIVVPKAITAAEKLQMKGEPVNINTIEKEVKDAANRFSDSVKSVNSGGFFQRMADIFLSLVKVAGKIISVFIIFICVILLIAISISFFTFYVFGTSHLASVSHMLVDQSYIITVFSFGFLLACAVPVIALIYGGFRILLGGNSRSKWLNWTLLGLWILGIVMLAFTGAKTLVNFKHEAIKKEDRLLLMQPVNGNLYVQLADSTANGWRKTDDNNEDEDEDEMSHVGIVINGRNLSDIDVFPVGEPEFELAVSDNDSFYIQKVISSYGKDNTDALKNADMLLYSFSQTDSILNLSAKTQLAKTSKWRKQNLKIRLYVPEGKKVVFASNMDDIEATVKGNSGFDDTDFAGTTWIVEKGKVKCLNCEEDNAGTELEEQIQEEENKIKKEEKRIEKVIIRKEKNSKDKSDEDF
jgi:phage shock protein PspC (stress-responsive transcriptional regulator)